MEDRNDELAPTPVEALEDEPKNLLEQLAAKRREIAEHKEATIVIPGYDREPPLLLARYRLLDGAELNRIGDKIRREQKDRWRRTLYASVDTFIAACVGFYFDLGDGQQKPLTLDGEQITGYTPELAQALQFADELPNPITHRAVVLGLFANNDVAISQHAFTLNRWFQNTSIDVSEEFMEGNL